MKRVALMGVLAVLAGFLLVGTLSAQPGPGYGGGGPGYCGGGPGYGGGGPGYGGGGPGYGGGYCPWMGAGPGTQRGQGGWYCPWMGQQSGSPVAKPGQPLSADQAKALVEQDIRANPNLRAGKVTERDGAYEVEVVTKDGSLVDKIQVNKQTGWFRSGY